MCGGCICGPGIGRCTGDIAYVLEKLASFVAMTAVIICIVITVTISLGLGVGLGYNYCYVDMKILKTDEVNDTDDEPTKGKHLRSPVESGTNTDDEALAESDTDARSQALLSGGSRRLGGFAAVPSYRRRMPSSPGPRRTLRMPAIKHTIAIPLNEDFDFPALLSKLRSRNKNVTLELIT